MNTTVEKGVADWLRVLLAPAFADVPVLTADDETPMPEQGAAEPRFVRVICEEDRHEVGPLYLPEVRVEIASPMLGLVTLADHRALAAAVVDAFDATNLAALSSAMSAAAGRTVSGFHRLDEDRDGLRRREGYWQAGPVWRLGTQET